MQCSTRSWKSRSAYISPRKRTTSAGLNHETHNPLASSSNRENLEIFYSAARIREDAPTKACRKQLLDTRQIAASVVLLTSNPSLIDLSTRSLHTVQSLTTPSAPNPAAVLTRVPRFPAAGRDDDRGRREWARSRAIIQGYIPRRVRTSTARLCTRLLACLHSSRRAKYAYTRYTCSLRAVERRGENADDTL